MLRSSTQQTFIEAPVERVWELVGDPNHHPEWWPEVLEVECADLKEGCRYRAVTKGPLSVATHDLVVDRFEDCREVSIFCEGTGVTTRFRLTEAQGGTFVYVVNPDTTVDVRPVQVTRSWDTWAVVASGVSAGETVVVDGQMRLSPGAKATVKAPRGPAAQAETAEAARR